MNPSFDKLPSPDSSVPAGDSVGADRSPVSERFQPVPEHSQSADTASGSYTAAALPALPVAASPIPIAQSPDAQSSGAAATSTDDAASDDITRQYVLKAKAIVEQTAGDPYKQSLQMDQLRDDYAKRLGRIRVVKST